MKMLKELVQISEPLQYVPLSGLLNGKFYHTVFVPSGSKHLAYVLFEDGMEVEVKEYKNSKQGEAYSFFDLEKKRYVFNIQEAIWFQSGLVYGISMEAVSCFLDARIDDPKGLWSCIREQVNHYYDFCHSEELDIVVAHIIHTYFLGLTGRAIYLLLDGERNTGKSTLQNVMARLQYNGCFVGKSSIAAMVRKIHYLQAAVNLDEFEKLDPTERVVVTGILNSGAYASGTREIVNMDAKKSSNQITVYRTFGAKTFSVNKSRFDESFLSRCVVINTVRNRKSVKDIYGLSYQEETAFQALRDSTFCYVLKHGQSIIKDIKSAQAELQRNNLYGRRSDILSILLGIIQHFGGDVESIRRYLNEKEGLDTEDEAQNDRTYFTLKYLVELSLRQSQDCTEFENGDLLRAVVEGLGIDECADPKYRPTPASIGRMLKRTKLVTSKKDRMRVAGKGNYKYLIPKERIFEIIRRAGFDDLVEMIDFKNSFTNSHDTTDESGKTPVNIDLNPSQDPSQPF